MITHGTFGGIENNCILCTGDTTLGTENWPTTFSRTGKIETTFKFQTVLALDK